MKPGLTVKEELKFSVFENRVLRKVKEGRDNRGVQKIV
jgi:hypothetical protein